MFENVAAGKQSRQRQHHASRSGHVANREAEARNRAAAAFPSTLCGFWFVIRPDGLSQAAECAQPALSLSLKTIPTPENTPPNTLRLPTQRKARGACRGPQPPDTCESPTHTPAVSPASFPPNHHHHHHHRGKPGAMDTRKLLELLTATIESDHVQRKNAEDQLTQVGSAHTLFYIHICIYN